MDTEQLCMGCMRAKGAAEVCPQCGYRIDANRNPMVLPYQTVLNNKFLIGRLLGAPGGFGVTYLAWDLVLHTTVAIKEYFPRNLACRDVDHATVRLQNTQESNHYEYGLKQFLQEARTLAQFNHPNVVRVREFFSQNHTAYLVMDYYEGISLEEYVHRKGGRITEEIALNLILPVLDGLRIVHEKGFLHRDIKPSNIYLTKSGAPILLDFGAARFALNQHSQTLTVILSAGFAPFEQYISKNQHGHWIDIYACGATLYAVTTGTLPQDALSRFQKDELRPPIELIPALTPRFSQVLMQTLDMEPTRRPQNVSELQSLLLERHPRSATMTAASKTIPATVVAAPSKAIPPTVAKPQSTISVRCPHCKTPNTITSGMPINQLRCYRCSKKFSEPSPKEASRLSWKMPTLLVAFAIFGVFLLNSEEPAPAVTVVPPQNANAVAEPQSVASQTAAEVDNIPQPQTPIPSVQPSAEPNTVDNTIPSVPTRIPVTQPPVVTQQRPEMLPASPQYAQPGPESPPEFSVAACQGLQQGTACSALQGTILGVCLIVRDKLACIPNDRIGRSSQPEGLPNGGDPFRAPPR